MVQYGLSQWYIILHLFQLYNNTMMQLYTCDLHDKSNHTPEQYVCDDI